MPLLHALPVAVTSPGSPRASASVAYNGQSDMSVHVQPVCPGWVTANPAVVLLVEAQQSFDSEATWEDFAQLETSPPNLTRAGGVPTMTCQVTDDLGLRRVRVLLSVAGAPLACGVDITV